MLMSLSQAKNYPLLFFLKRKGRGILERKQYEDNYYTGYDLFRKKYAM